MFRKLTHRWGGLLLVLVLAFFLEALFGPSFLVELSCIALFAIALLGALAIAKADRLLRTAGLAIAIIWFFVSTAMLFGAPLQGPAIVMSGLLVLCSLYGTFAYLMTARRSDLEVLLGAIYGYLVLAMAWALLFLQIEASRPGSFSVPLNADPWSTFLYYSIVTLTTLGYGDVTPVSNLARLAAGFESIIGVLYIAVLVGSIIGSYQRRPDR
ncbi:MAG: potassium channel family protein [Pseudomonadota bacterium]